MRPGQSVVEFLSGMFYQGGPNAASATGDTIRIAEGWVNPDDLRANLKDSVVNITVWGTPAVRDTSGLRGDWRVKSLTAPSIAVQVSGNVVTLSGAVQTPQVIDLLVNEQPCAYSIQQTDTLETIAAALAGLTSGNAAGSVVTIPGAREIVVRVVTQGQIAKTVRREERLFHVTTWASTPVQRDRVADLVDAWLSDVRRLPGLNLHWAGGHADDELQKQGCYRRILMLRIEGPIELTQSDWTIGIAQVNHSGGPSPDVQGPVHTSYS